MLEGAELQELAKRAKEQLSKQQVFDLEEVSLAPEEDLYAEFRDNKDEYHNTGAYLNQQINPKNTPTEYIENPKLQQEPEKEYYEQEKGKIMSYDERIFHEGPTKIQVDLWKKQWAGYDIFSAEIMDSCFVFRTLNRFEYKQLVAMENIDPLQREEIICETVTLWPAAYDWRNMATDKAGIPSTYAEIIMEKSGFTKEYTIQVL